MTTGQSSKREVVLVPRVQLDRTSSFDPGPSEHLLRWAERFGLPGVDEWQGSLEVYFKMRQEAADDEERRQRTIKRARVSAFAPDATVRIGLGIKITSFLIALTYHNGQLGCQ